MDYIEGGSLEGCLKKGSLSLPDKINALKDVTLGMQEVHDKGIVHFDIKEANILYDTSQKKAYVADVGLSQKKESVEVTDFRGTLKYMAPEVKKKCFAAKTKKMLYKLYPDKKEVYKREFLATCEETGIPSSSADVYSVGIMAFQMLANKGVVQSLEYSKTVKEGIVFIPKAEDFNDLPEDIRSDVFNLVSNCLKEMPRDRITFKDAEAQLAEIATKLSGSAEEV